MNELFTLSFGQYNLVLNTLNLSVAILAGFALFFALMIQSVSTVYRVSIALMSAVVAMASYHYLRIYQNWRDSFSLESGSYIPTDIPFNYAYRYADWLGTVPLILAATILVLDLSSKKSASLVARLSISAVLMIALGYFGEIERTNMAARAIWGAVSTIPFIYIVFVLWVEMSKTLEFESKNIKWLFTLTRLLLLASWGFYPIVFMFPIFGLSGAGVEVAIQVGNSAADIIAKAGMGLFIFAIARQKSEEQEEMMLPS